MDIPNKNVDRETRRKWFMELCQKYVEKYLGFSEVGELVDHTTNLQVNAKGPFPCRIGGCERQFVYHSGRVR
jgi:hypothetical protein